MPKVAEPHAPAPRPLVVLLAVAAGVAVANLYYNQPLLAAIGQTFDARPRALGAIPTVTQLGYGLAMLVLVPLGDRFERRGLIAGMSAAAAVALVLVAVAPSLPALAAASLALGLASMVPQYIVPYAAGAASPRERGRVVGVVMSGLLVGILLSRTVAGFVGGRLGWRVVYGGAAALMLLLAGVLRARLPAQHPERRVPFRELYASLVTIVRTEPVLRLHSILGALTFGAFSVFWSTLVFHLASLPAHYGSEVAGAYGIVGVAGALAAPLVGRFADRRDPRIINAAAILTVLAAFVVFYALRTSLAGLALGVVLLDLGAQSNHISNQTRIFGLSPALRNRLNTVYMSSYFAGGALGSLLGAFAWGLARWAGVCVAGGALAAAAMVVFVLLRVTPPRSPRTCTTSPSPAPPACSPPSPP